VGKPEGKRPLGRPRLRWGSDIKMHFQEIGYRDIDSIERAEDWNRWWALVNAVMNLRLP
jgi:hypothetical protein